MAFNYVNMCGIAFNLLFILSWLQACIFAQHVLRTHVHRFCGLDPQNAQQLGNHQHLYQRNWLMTMKLGQNHMTTNYGHISGMITVMQTNDAIPPDTKKAKQSRPSPESLEGYVHIHTNMCSLLYIRICTTVEQ